jgi:hypothetical protein
MRYATTNKRQLLYGVHCCLFAFLVTNSLKIYKSFVVNASIGCLNEPRTQWLFPARSETKVPLPHSKKKNVRRFSSTHPKLVKFVNLSKFTKKLTKCTTSNYLY